MQVNKEKKKLLFVGAFPKNSNTFGGNITACNELMASDFSNKVDVLKLDSTQQSHPLPGFFKRLFYAIKRLILFFSILKNEKVDCILIFAAWGFSLVEKGVMARIAFYFKKPVLFFPRGGHLVETFNHSIFSRILTRFALKKSSKILCQGEAIKNICTNSLNFSKKNTPIVQNWTASNDLIEIGDKKNLKDDYSLNFLFVGWLDFEKGLKEILQSFRKISLLYPVNLNLIGKGNAWDFANDFIEENNIKNVNLHGWLKKEKVKKFYEKSDVLLLPSWLEGFPNVIVEAMSSKVFVISSNVGNIADIIKNGETGFLVKKKDAEDLFSKMKISIENSSLRKDCVNNAFLFAKENLTVDVASNKILRHIEDAINYQ